MYPYGTPTISKMRSRVCEGDKQFLVRFNEPRVNNILYLKFEEKNGSLSVTVPT